MERVEAKEEGDLASVAQVLQADGALLHFATVFRSWQHGQLMFCETWYLLVLVEGEPTRPIVVVVVVVVVEIVVTNVPVLVIIEYAGLRIFFVI